MGEQNTGNNGNKSIYILMEELTNQLERSRRVNETLSEQIHILNNRLTVLETQGHERLTRCTAHEGMLTQHDKRIGSNEKDIATLSGSWKTYMMIGGFSGVIGAVITAIAQKGLP